MTLRLKALFEALPKNNYNILETAKMLGYSESYAISHIYDVIRKYQSNDNEESIREEFIVSLRKDIKRFKREKDNTSYMRAKELLSKILALQVERTINTNLNTNIDEKEELNKLRLPLLSLTN